MAQWIDPIFDRTLADVKFAIAKMSEWRNNNSTDVYELKGCLNVSDINRIENDIQYLSDRLSELYYFPHTTSKVWDMEGLPDKTEVERIIKNVGEIISAYFQYDTASDLPNTLLTHEHINAVEENLFLLKQMLDNMTTSYRECGTFECGEDD